jgi:hypothetical protein
MLQCHGQAWGLDVAELVQVAAERVVAGCPDAGIGYGG